MNFSHIVTAFDLAVMFFAFFLNQHLLRLNARLLAALHPGNIPKGKAFIRITDTISSAVTYWNPKKGCCDVYPVFFPAKDRTIEMARAESFYGPSGRLESLIRFPVEP